MQAARLRVSHVIALIILLAGLATPSWAQTPPAEALWPQEIHTPVGASVVVYQPQVSGWQDHKVLTARAAVAITPADAKQPILGTIDVSADTDTDVTSRVVHLTDMKLVSSHFPTLGTDQAAALEARIRDAMPGLARKEVPLDAVLMSLAHTTQAAQPVMLNDDPPVIFASARPASLVVFDGAPVLAPVGTIPLRSAVNTNWDVFVDATGTWYLLNNGVWLSAPAVTGPYQPVRGLPPAFTQMPNDQNFADVRRAIPARPAANPALVPTIFVSTKPAEIIVTDGPPKFAPIAGTRLEYATNTDADVFRYTPTGQVYFLASGRWFSAASLDGPWQFATRQLPPDFAMIPPNSPRGRVLASVPGTEAAQVAVLQAQIPQQASLSRAGATLNVTYVGAPAFSPIPGTKLTYATNTPYQVIGVSGVYYACYQGAWFTAPSPTGPWMLATSVPPAIYTIPPSSPLYNVTYVSVYAATPTTVTFGYTAGYTMGFVTAGVLVYGTGWYYPPVVIAGTVPAYLPYHTTYTGGVWYNSATGSWAHYGTVTGAYGGTYAHGTAYNANTGTWAHGSAIYGPNGGAGAWSAYNPATGTYAHGSAAWGPNGGSAHAGFYNPTTGVSGSTTQNANPYERWGSSTVSGPNKTVNTASASNAHGSAGGFSSSTGAAGAGYHGANGNSGGVVKGSGGDVYAGHNGNVYQHSTTGWSKWNDGSWQSVQRPSGGNATRPGTAPHTAGQFNSTAEYNQLEQDRRARTQGTQQQYGNRQRNVGAGAARFR